MGIYECGGYGSRGREKAVMGMRPWGYMQEEVGRRRRGGGGTFISNLTTPHYVVGKNTTT